MFAVLVNTIAIVLGAAIGMLLRRGIPQSLTDAVMQALGLCTVLIGIQGAGVEQNILQLIVALVVSVVIGEAQHWDGHVNRFTERLMSRYAKGEGEGARIAKAFVTSCLIMNVGAMVIVGSLNAGLDHDFSILYTKSLLDFCSGIMLTAAMGVGVFGSAVFTLIFQGVIVLLAEWIAPLVSPELIAELGTTGSILILAIGLNMLNITQFKVINYLPALIVVPFLLWVTHLFGF